MNEGIHTNDWEQTSSCTRLVSVHIRAHVFNDNTQDFLKCLTLTDIS